jgi:hypothetical protein
LHFLLILKKHKFQALTEEMDDTQILDVINNSQNVQPKASISFIFSLKNRIGGLARALKVFEVFIYITFSYMQFSN